MLSIGGTVASLTILLRVVELVFSELYHQMFVLYWSLPALQQLSLEVSTAVE